MFLPQKLKEIRQKHKLSQSALATEFGISRTAYHMWESGKTKPNQKNLERLADFFKVDVTYFESEVEIVEIYLQLNDKNQRDVLTFAKKRLEKQKEDEKIIEFPIQVRNQIVLAAGYGFGFDDEFETETVYASEEQPSHDVAVWIKGDSMLPKYVSGEVALIDETGFDYDGAVYAVVIYGETVIKKVYLEEEGIRLVSINKDYPDRFISSEEEVNVVGKVVGHFMPI